MIFIVVIDFTHSEARPAKAAVPESAGVAEEDKAAFAGVGAQAAVDSERQRRDGLLPAFAGVGAHQASVKKSAPSSTPHSRVQSSGVA